jgi:hypothetical protein
MDAAIIIGTYIIVFFAGYGLRAYRSLRRRRRCFAYDFPPYGSRAGGLGGDAGGVCSDEERRRAAASPALSRTRSLT